ncbi:hypothetical protein [Streptomyces exfoliatus]|uniref:hypothetical protein n=1 Tax=Streptomyces exfoliatus TaxID=1905 RepID=UPI003C2BFF0C
MSFVRRAAVISLVAASLVATGVAGSAVAAPTAAKATAPAADGPFGHGGGRPIQFGPFAIPSNGNVMAGFAWDTSNGRGGF